MLTGAPQVSSGEQLILEQILRKMQIKNDPLLFSVMLRIFYMMGLKMQMKWLWLRRDAENVQDWTDKEDEVNEVGKKYEETTTWTIDGSESICVPRKLINICMVKLYFI